MPVNFAAKVRFELEIWNARMMAALSSRITQLVNVLTLFYQNGLTHQKLRTISSLNQSRCSSGAYLRLRKLPNSPKTTHDSRSSLFDLHCSFHSSTGTSQQAISLLPPVMCALQSCDEWMDISAASASPERMRPQTAWLLPHAKRADLDPPS